MERRKSRKETLKHTIEELVDELESRVSIVKSASSIPEEISNFKEKNLKSVFDLANWVAPKVAGHESIRVALGLQMLSPQNPVHILIIGEPASAKTAMLLACAETCENSSYCVGRSATFAGLTLSVARFGEIEVGSLPKAHFSVCYIDEVLYMDPGAITALYTAMQSGFVKYDKAYGHFKLPAMCAVALGTTPLGETWHSTSLEEIRNQVPFKTTLLTRCHLTFLIPPYTIGDLSRVLDAKEDEWFGLTKTPSKGEIEKFKAFISFARKLKVEIPLKVREISKKILKPFVLELMRQSNPKAGELILPISPRTYEGLQGLAMALARFNLRENVVEQDLKDAVKILIEPMVMCGFDWDVAVKKVKALKEIYEG
jgi:DNA replicative helicase MCM subunit Mcm2 (Cdc46/Mcm family)